MILVGTSMTGAAIIVYGISLFASIIPPERYIFTLVKRKETWQLGQIIGWDSLVLFISFFLLLFFGIMFQNCIQNEKIDDLPDTENIHENYYMKISQKLA
jgi:hypothetical protein